MARLNVDYDLLTWEGHILRLQFWARAFEILKEKGAVYLQTEGKLAGCWVMRIEDDETGTGGSGTGESDERRRTTRARESHRPIERHGHLRRQGHRVSVLEARAARPRFPLPPVRHAAEWQRAVVDLGDGRRAQSHPPFGRASATYNVIDVRQSYLQKLLKQALRTLGYTEQAERATHFSYEMVALSNTTARTLGYLAADAPDDKRGFVDVSGRKGQGVKADDLLDTLIARAEAEVAKRNPEFTRGRASAHRRDDRRGGGALLHGEVLAHENHCVRYRRSARVRG